MDPTTNGGFEQSKADGTGSNVRLNQLCDKCKSLFTSEWHALPVIVYEQDLYWRLEARTDEVSQSMNIEELDSEVERLSQYIDLQAVGIHYEKFDELDVVVSSMSSRPVFHHDLYHLHMSSQEGCHFCTALWISLYENFNQEIHGLEGMPQDLLKAINVLPFLRNPDSFRRTQKQPELMIWTFQRSSLARPIGLNSTYKLVESIQQIKQPKGSAALREETLSNLTEWIQTCMSSHNGCQFHPTLHIYLASLRLLRIWGNNENDMYIQLVEMANIVERASYATLSYRRDDMSKTRLTYSTHAEFSKGIAISGLARTFREAAVVCQALDIEYLWIDVFCILQDDEKDRRYHADVMAHIYAGASLNLAATYSTDVHGGLLGQSENLLALNPPVLNIDWRGDYTFGGEYAALNTNLWRKYVALAPLNSRGWVGSTRPEFHSDMLTVNQIMQEALFSRRTIHFASNQIWWRCRRSYGSETATHADLGAPGAHGPLPYRKVKSWMNFVGEYRNLELIDDKDVLVAFAAIAAMWGKMEGYSSEDYLAGIWKPGLPHQLLWTTRDGQHRTDELVPSWTWASVAGGESRKRNLFIPSVTVDLGMMRVHPRLKILETCANNRRADSFSEARGVYLRVQGHLHPVSLTRPRQVRVGLERMWKLTELQIGAHRRLHIHPSLNCDFPVGTLDSAPQNSAPLTRWNLFLADTDQKNSCQEPITSAFFLPVLSSGPPALDLTISPPNNFCKTMRVSGLLLAPTTEQGSYRRIGVLQLLTEDLELSNHQSYYADVSDLPEWHEGAALEFTKYLKDHGGGCYEIKIV